MTIGDHKPTPTPAERRKVRFGSARQIVIAAAAAMLAILGFVVFAIE
jgi:hypothetical protein